MGRGSAVRETASQSARVTSESYQMTELEKRFDLSPEGVRLNVSAGLPTPLMSDCKARKEPFHNRHDSNSTTIAIFIKDLPADGKWRLTVRPVHKAVIREHVLGLSA